MKTLRARLARYLFLSTDPRRRGLSWWDASELGLVALGFLLYFLVRGAVVDRTADAFANAHWIVNFQFSYGLFVEPAFQAWVLEYELLRRGLNFVYFWMDFPLIVAVAMVMFWKRRHAYTLTRDSMLISGGLALVVYWLYPVAPPRFLSEWGFIDTLEVYDNLSYQAQSLQPFVNPFAAVPSLHVGWALLLAAGVFAATRNPWLRGASLLTFVLQSIAVVGTGNHYIFDSLAGLAVCGVALGLTLVLHRGGYPRLRRWLEAWAGMAPARSSLRRPSRPSSRGLRPGASS